MPFLANGPVSGSNTPIRIAPDCATRIVSRLVEGGFYPNVIHGNEIFRRRRPDRPRGPETTRVAFCEYTAENVDDILPHVRSGATQIGAVMGKVLPQFKGRADGGTINAIAREELSKQG